jgi:hypothetical protein
MSSANSGDFNASKESSLSDLRIQRIRQLFRKGIAAKRTQILSEINLLIFGPANGKDGYADRQELRKHVQTCGCRADYPEDVLDPKVNPLAAEQVLADQYNLIFVVLKGQGPIAEISSYLRIANLAPKFRIFQEAKYIGSPSFVNEVIQPFCQMYKGHCNTFSEERELKKAASKTIDTFVLYTLTYGYKPS